MKKWDTIAFPKAQRQQWQSNRTTQKFFKLPAIQNISTNQNQITWNRITWPVLFQVVLTSFTSPMPAAVTETFVKWPKWKDTNARTSPSSAAPVWKLFPRVTQSVAILPLGNRWTTHQGRVTFFMATPSRSGIQATVATSTRCSW